LVESAGGIRAADAPEVLDQCQTQHDGDGPQFAQFEGSNRLISCTKRLRLPGLPVHRRAHRLQRNVIKHREVPRKAVQQAGQFPTVALASAAWLCESAHRS